MSKRKTTTKQIKRDVMAELDRLNKDVERLNKIIHELLMQPKEKIVFPPNWYPPCQPYNPPQWTPPPTWTCSKLENLQFRNTLGGAE